MPLLRSDVTLIDNEVNEQFERHPDSRASPRGLPWPLPARPGPAAHTRYAARRRGGTGTATIALVDEDDLGSGCGGLERCPAAGRTAANDEHVTADFRLGQWAGGVF